MTRRERNQSRKGTKRALTGSILAIVLCVVLLAGATFAWFTDTASTKVSKIESGTLDIELAYATEWDNEGNPSKWATADENTVLEFRKAGENSLWEPGCTFTLPQLKVVNKGNLALKYKVVVSAIKGDAELANVLNVTLKDGEKNAQELGTLKALSEAEQKDITENYLLAVDGQKETAPLTISVQMDKDAGNEYQGKTITGVTVSVVATQYTYENDSTGNQYDKDAEYATPVATVDDLKTAVAAGKDVVLTEDIKLTEDLTISKDNVTIFGNGNTVTGKVWVNGDAESVTIKDVVFDGPENGNGNASNLYINGSVKSVTIENCTFKNTQWDAVQITPVTGASITITGCTFEEPSATATKPQRYIHIEADPDYQMNDVNIVISNNTFASSAKLKNDIIGLYFINVDLVDFGGNNTFADRNGDVYICGEGTAFTRTMSSDDAYKALTGE